MHPFKTDDLITIPHGAEPPGHMILERGKVRWSGELCWQTRHGPATMLWIAGRPAEAYDAILPDGNRAPVVSQGDPEAGTWRCLMQDGLFEHGSLTVLENEIAFQVSETGLQQPQRPKGSLSATLLSAGGVGEAARDRMFAEEIYGALCSVLWTHGSGKEHFGTWMQAAETAAALRGKGETWADYFLCGNEGDVSGEVEDLLSELGWEPSGYLKSPEDMRKAERLLEICEKRPPTEMPGWYAYWITGLQDGKDSAAGRIHMAAFLGKVTLSEWARFWELYDFGDS